MSFDQSEAADVLPVHQRGRGEVIHQVQQTQPGQVPPVREAGRFRQNRFSTSGLHEVVGVQQLIEHEAVSLHPLCELVSLAAERHRLIVTLSQQSDLEKEFLYAKNVHGSDHHTWLVPTVARTQPLAITPSQPRSTLVTPART